MIEQLIEKLFKDKQAFCCDSYNDKFSIMIERLTYSLSYMKRWKVMNSNFYNLEWIIIIGC